MLTNRLSVCSFAGLYHNKKKLIGIFLFYETRVDKETYKRKDIQDSTIATDSVSAVTYKHRYLALIEYVDIIISLILQMLVCTFATQSCRND